MILDQLAAHAAERVEAAMARAPWKACRTRRAPSPGRFPVRPRGGGGRTLLHLRGQARVALQGAHRAGLPVPRNRPGLPGGGRGLRVLPHGAQVVFGLGRNLPGHPRGNRPAHAPQGLHRARIPDLRGKALGRGRGLSSFARSWTQGRFLASSKSRTGWGSRPSWKPRRGGVGRGGGGGRENGGRQQPGTSGTFRWTSGTPRDCGTWFRLAFCSWRNLASPRPGTSRRSAKSARTRCSWARRSCGPPTGGRRSRRFGRRRDDENQDLRTLPAGGGGICEPRPARLCWLRVLRKEPPVCARLAGAGAARDDRAVRPGGGRVCGRARGGNRIPLPGADHRNRPAPRKRGRGLHRAAAGVGSRRGKSGRRTKSARPPIWTLRRKARRTWCFWTTARARARASTGTSSGASPARSFWPED